MLKLVKFSASVALTIGLTAAPAHAQISLKGLTDKVLQEATGKNTAPQQSILTSSRIQLPVSNEQYLKDFKNYEKTIIQGAAIGALIGGGAALIAGGGKEEATIAAGVGGAIGGFIGKETAKKSAGISMKRKSIKKALKKAEKHRTRALVSVENTRKNNIYIKERISIMRERFLRGGINKQEAQADLSVFEATLSMQLEKNDIIVANMSARQKLIAAAVVEMPKSDNEEVKEYLPDMIKKEKELGSAREYALATTSDINIIKGELDTVRSEMGLS
ncbi:MAG: hypothetical protein COA91_13845 [Robiginitomaculum sp.]|nr:MAG: hypothetical protein COA91_13845 [Robiginitomaculum sp.]